MRRQLPTACHADHVEKESLVDLPETTFMDGASEIKWAPRIPKNKIRRLYEADAVGILDEDLIEDVGISLFLRCESILTVSQARAGKVLCPRCDSSNRETMIVRHSSHKKDILLCKVCGWRTRWGDYQKTYRGKQLHEGGAGQYFSAFMHAYRKCRSPKDKMLAIDRVIHDFHYNTVRGRIRPTRAACVNLIQGRLTDVVKVVDDLAYGDATTTKITANREKWACVLGSLSN